MNGKDSDCKYKKKQSVLGASAVRGLHQGCPVFFNLKVVPELVLKDQIGNKMRELERRLIKIKRTKPELTC